MVRIGFWCGILRNHIIYKNILVNRVKEAPKVSGLYIYIYIYIYLFIRLLDTLPRKLPEPIRFEWEKAHLELV